jgi:peptidoglycan/LPS O-acetylase OafA/YrhL
MDGLDVLRGLAVLLVLLAHVPNRPRPDLGVSEQVLGFFSEIGWVGVDLFYVLSGFLISGLLFKEIKVEGKLNVLRFWWRRGLKIWPCYFLVYGTYVATNLYAAHSKGQTARYLHYVETLRPNCLFFQNYSAYELIWPASWSIAVEEHFYFLLPLVLGLILFLARRPSTSQRWTRGVLALGCLSLVIPVLLRWRTAAAGVPWFETTFPTHLRCDSLLAGVLLRFTKEYMPSVFGRIRLVGRRLCPILLSAAAVLAYHYPLQESPKYYVLGFTLNYLAFTLLVAVAVRRRRDPATPIPRRASSASHGLDGGRTATRST